MLLLLGLLGIFFGLFFLLLLSHDELRHANLGNPQGTGPLGPTIRFFQLDQTFGAGKHAASTTSSTTNFQTLVDCHPAASLFMRWAESGHGSRRISVRNGLYKVETDFMEALKYKALPPILQGQRWS